MWDELGVREWQKYLEVIDAETSMVDEPTIVTPHQKRLLVSMQQSISDYQSGKVNFSEMVGALEGALDAGEFNDNALTKQWYVLWTPLEIARATTGDETSRVEIAVEVSRLYEYLTPTIGDTKS